MKVMIVEDEEGIRKLLVKIVSKNESGCCRMCRFS